MAKISFYHDLRSIRKDGTAQIKINMSHNRKTALIKTGVYVQPTQWNSSTRMVCKHSRKADLNKFLNRFYCDVEEAVLNLQRTGELQKLTITELKKRVLSILDNGGNDSPTPSFLACFNNYINSCKKQRTKEIYTNTLKRITQFYPNVENLRFEDIDKDWLEKFDSWLTQYCPKRNARNIHLRNIRAVFNAAIDNEITVCYPFRKIKIKYQRTPKRSLTVDEIRSFFNAEVEPYQIKYLDLFKLMFFLAGINLVDLVNLKEIVSGRIEYYRAKTGRFYSMKVEPEALAIINKYRGQEYLIDILDTYKDYRNFTPHMNEALKNIGPMKRQGKGGKKIRQPLFPNISTYWARHSWATIAASLDIPKETIAAGLGHGTYTTTDIYIDFDQQKVDDAVRKVIDWVLYNKKLVSTKTKGSRVFLSTSLLHIL